MITPMLSPRLFTLALMTTLLAAPCLAQDEALRLKPLAPNVGEQSPESFFAKAIEDLPLMKTMEVVPENDIVFFFPGGRIAQTVAKGFVDVDSVYYFYQETLPQLGWKMINRRLYERGGEQLTINASSANADGKTYIKFEVKPIKRR